MDDGTADEMADEIQMSCGNQNELGYFQQKYSPLLGSLEANPTVSISPHKRMKKYLFQNHLLWLLVLKVSKLVNTLRKKGEAYLQNQLQQFQPIPMLWLKLMAEIMCIPVHGHELCQWLSR